MIQVDNLTVRYGLALAAKDVSFTVARSEP
jgi:ABC-type branched-subunit amino acid transport system ATPase component